MVSVCPSECDPKENVEEFVRNRAARILPGLRMEGLEPLVRVLIEEMRKQRPEERILLVNRELLCDNGIDFQRELSAYLDNDITDWNHTSVIFVESPLPGWEKCAESCCAKGADVFFASFGCRQVPLVTRLALNP